MFHCIFEINYDKIGQIIQTLIEEEHFIHGIVGKAIFTTTQFPSANNPKIHNDDCLLQVECWIDT